METRFRSIDLAPGVRGMVGLSSGVTHFMGIESPRTDVSAPGAIIRLRGWFFSRDRSVARLALSGPGEAERDVPLSIGRPDVQASAHRIDPDFTFPEVCGFDMCVAAPAHSEFEMALSAVSEDGEVTRVALLKGELLHGADGPGRRRGAGGILIAGFHRSGTSMLAQALSAGGLGLGNELVPPALSNPNGHFEDCWAVDIHTAMLSAHGLDWKVRDASTLRGSTEHLSALAAYVGRRSNDAAMWAVKDPRAGLFAREWLDVAPDITIAATVRGPDQCAASLRSRQAAEIVRDPFAASDCSLALWSDVNLPLELWCAHYESLLACSQRRPGAVHYLPQQSVAETPVEALRALIGSGAELPASPVQRELLGERTAEHSFAGVTQEVLERLASITARLGVSSIEVPAAAYERPVQESEGSIWLRVQAIVHRLPFTGPPPDERSHEEGAGADALGRARLAMAQRQWTVAADALSCAWVEPAKRSELAHRHAEVLMRLGKWSEALAIYSARLSVSSDAKALAASAECLLLLGRFGDAEDAVRQLISSSPDEPWPWQHAARTVTRLADTSLTSTFSKAIDARASRSHADWVAVQALWEMRRGNLRRGAALLGPFHSVSEQGTALLREALIESELRQARREAARALWTAHFLRAHEPASYLAGLHAVIQKIQSPSMRIDLLGHVERQLTTMVAMTASETTLAPSSEQAASFGGELLRRLGLF